MTERVIFAAEHAPAPDFAAAELKKMGFTVTHTPSPAVTHLLLGIPCKLSGEQVQTLLEGLRPDITILGGYLDFPEMAAYRRFDLLQNDVYLAKNAAITACAAVTLAASSLRVAWDGCPVLVLGWGRIGKCLAAMLKALGARVCVAVRKEQDRAILSALDYDAVDITAPEHILGRFRVIFNTVPHPVLTAAHSSLCRKDCLKIDLASKAGIAGEDVIIARGLPGKYLPESSGKLIAQTILKYFVREEGSL